MNPFVPVINLKIGELDFTSNVNNIVSMTNTRISDTLSQSTVFTIFDETSLVVEAEIVKQKNPIMEFSYGYANGAMSKKYKATILKYSPSFEGGGVTLTLEGAAESAIAATNSSSRSYDGLRIAGLNSFDEKIVLIAGVS